MASGYFTFNYFKKAAERAVRSFAGAYTAVGAFVAKDFFSADSLKAALGAAAFSFLLAYGTKGLGDNPDSPSIL